MASGETVMRVGCFIIETFRHPRRVGTLAESSRFLAKKLVQQMNGAVNVVEFGAGTGSVTLEILKHLPEHGQLTCFEISPYFCRYLKSINDSRLNVINDDAQNYERYVDGSDCIISGLPLSLFGKSKREKIIALSSRSGTYIQFQYTPFLRSEMRRYFRDVKIKFVPLNFPPAFVYVCTDPVG